MKAAMFSYNTFVSGQSNGWRAEGDNSVFLIQNVSGDTWGATQAGRPADMQSEGEGLVDRLWSDFERELAQMDQVVIYVGSHGAERAIERAAACGLDPSKASFVFCDCNRSRKQAIIRDRGFGESRVIDAECGGHMTMLSVYESLLKTGALS